MQTVRNTSSLNFTILIILPYLRRWNDIIGASPKLMRNFKLHLPSTYDSSLKTFISWGLKIDEILSLKRSFQSMYILWNVPSETVLKVTAKHGSQIRNLSIFNGKDLKANDFQELLKHMPLLEELEVAQTEFNVTADEIRAIYPAQLRMLRSIKITCGTNWIVFRYLVGTQAKHLDVSLMRRIQSDEATLSLMAFLKASKCLESMNFDEAFIHNIFKTDESQSFSFQLKSLSFFYKASTDDSEKTVARFCKFLVTNASSLDGLVLRNSSEEILKAVFNHIKKIKKLNLRTSNMPANKQFYEKLTPMENLQQLDCNDFIPNEDAAKGLLGLCPNLKSLKVSRDQIISSLTPFMATYNPNIEILKLDTIKDKIETEVKFKYLKLLYVILNGNDESLKLLLKSNPTIETFGLRLAGKSDVVDFLLTMPNIKHLKFGGEVATLKEIFDKIVLSGAKHLETLQIIFEKVPGRPSVLFELPADSNKWDSKCPFLRRYVKNADSEFGYRISVNHITDF